MSIIWLDGLINYGENKEVEFEGGFIFILINIFSIISSVVFFQCYRKNVQMQKAPCKNYI